MHFGELFQPMQLQYCFSHLVEIQRTFHENPLLPMFIEIDPCTMYANDAIIHASHTNVNEVNYDLNDVLVNVN